MAARGDQRWAKCPGCGAKFMYVTSQPPKSCGTVSCKFKYGPMGDKRTGRGVDGATEREWESRARFALVRQECGKPLNNLDREALERYPSPRSLFKMAFDESAA